MKVFIYTILLLLATTWAHASAAAGSSARQLVFLSDEPTRVLACIPLEAGAPFYFDFINSIYLAPVRETLVYTEGEGVSIVRVESPSAGVFEYYGLEPDSSGSVELHRSVGKIKIRSNSYENHRLTAGGKTISLKEIVNDGQPIIVEVRTNGTYCGH
jgi:hypothetical protein